MAIGFLLLIAATAHAELQPQSVAELTADLIVSARGSIEGDLSGIPIELRVLSIESTNRQTVLFRTERLFINGKTIEGTHTLDQNNNPYATFVINEPGEFEYRIEARVQVNADLLGLNDTGLGADASCNTPTQSVQSTHTIFAELAKTKFASNRWIESVAEINQWTHTFLTYDTRYYPKTYSALETLESQRGTCDEYAVLAAAILRAKGQCTRFVVGPVYSGNQWGYHAWLETKHPQNGWIPLDPTYGEVGTVDATHITMGIFDDPLHAIDTLRGPSSARIGLLPKTVHVNVLETRTHKNPLDIHAPPLSLVARQWTNIQIELENPLEQYLVVPMAPVFPAQFSVDPENQVLLLAPRKKTAFFFSVYADYNLEKNQYLEGNYSLATIGNDLVGELRVTPENAPAIERKIEILDATSYYNGTTATLTITLKNPKAKNVDIQFIAPGIRQTTTLQALATTTHRFSFQATPPRTTARLQTPDQNHDFNIPIPKTPQEQPAPLTPPALPNATNTPAPEPAQKTETLLPNIHTDENGPLLVAITGLAVLSLAGLIKILLNKHA